MAGPAPQRVVIPYSPRAQFLPLHETTKRFGAVVAHRRAGKTVACVNHLVRAALTCPLPDPRYAYIAPYYSQAKDVAWTYLKKFSAPIPGISVNESELRVDYPNGARVRLYGAENYDRMRGLYFDGIVPDEYGDMDPRAWPEVFRPALSDRRGWTLFIGTPKGKNHFYDLWTAAGRDPAWFTLMLKASETGILPPEELADARKSMSEEQYEQEYECSFEAAILGAYYASEFKRIDADNRIRSVLWEPNLPVHTAWDLGIDDATAIWFVQQAGREVRVIDYYEASGAGLDHYAKVLKEKPYSYGSHFLPHDVEVTELGTGKSRYAMLQSLGVRPTVVRRATVEDGINAARVLLARCWFDADKCERGLNALRQYRKEFDDKTKTWRARPLHDWTSHAADAFRYLAQGLPQHVQALQRPARAISDYQMLG